ncbi:multidrug effflux MFS transporter [Paroceanicella profunda]|uniref:Bcr/CflA family efflux transporter n=1 Tax=Paroceanicella profunda TaxID=2579971 RepID=A0A5B8FW87_9RHOB|nr:multidrug effflux MFS transporter [Paroceanicella profunda]QDL91480.1 multidrug effflux MFS transporter [Paroceanicella profunda]
MTIETLPALRAGRLTVVLGALTAFAPFATDMYLSGFPAIEESFGTGAGEVQFSLSVFFLGVAIGQLIYGPVIDRFGRKLPLCCGVALFSVVSLGLAAAPDIGSFLAGRFLQALGGCAGMIVSRAIIADLFGAQDSARVLSMMMLVQGLGPVLAPIAGGYLLAFAGWRSIFVALALFGAACLVAALRVVPETLPPERRRKAGPGEILRTFRALLTRRALIVPALASALAFGALFSYISGSPFVFIDLHGVDPQVYKWLFGLNALGMILASQVNRLLLRRLRAERIFLGAIGMNILCGLALLALSGTAPLAVMMVPLWLCISTIPLIAANGMAIAMSHSGRHGGSASSIIGVLQFGLAALFSALVGILHNDTAFPMSGCILAAGVSAGLVLVIGRFGRA